ncbi:MAG: hypothetical protein Q8M24_14760 [Pseudolabrys sp.]|nr:hypothetical protein [Pseudolabrys sp.]MDP2296708.1 hypothetical protein [Pseudolabrys sp.]
MRQFREKLGVPPEPPSVDGLDAVLAGGRIGCREAALLKFCEPKAEIGQGKPET